MSSSPRLRPQLAWLLALTVLALPSILRSAPLEAWEDLLRDNHQGWRGADGAYSLRLSPTVTLWLFGDTVISRAEDGSRRDSRIVNNSLALQIGEDPKRAAIRFYWDDSDPKRPKPFFQAGEDRWHWPYDGIRVGHRLHIFLMDVEKTDAQDVFGFRQVGSSLATVIHPDRSPLRWQPQKVRVPFGLVTRERQRFWGSTVLPYRGHLYIYGYEEDLTSQPTTKRWVLARAPLEEPEDFLHWEFFTGSGWSTEEADLAKGEFSVPVEFTVRADPAGGFQMVHSVADKIGPGVYRRHGKRPEGPWSEPEQLFDCPEEAEIAKSMCYSAKAHPDLRAPDSELLVTYCTNSLDFALMGDMRIYFPRFRSVPVR